MARMLSADRWRWAAERAVPPRSDGDSARVRPAARPDLGRPPSRPAAQREARADAPAGSSTSSPPIRSASSRPIARPRPKPAWPPVSRPRWKRWKIASRSSSADARALVADADHDLAARAARTRISDPRGLTRSALSSRMRRIRAIAAGVAERPHRPAVVLQRELDPALVGAELELGHHRAAELAQLDRLGAQLHLGVDAREIEQVGGEPAEPARLGPRPVQQRAGVLDVGLGVLQVVVQQLEHPVQRGQRRAQLVRGGGHERAPGLLLLAQPLPASPPACGPGRRPRRAPGRPAPRRPGPRARAPSAASRSRRSRRTSGPTAGSPRIRVSARPAAAASRNARVTTWTTPGSPRSTCADDRARARGASSRGGRTVTDGTPARTSRAVLAGLRSRAPMISSRP